VAKLTKSEKNTLCGKCHYNQQIFGGKAINPHDRHASSRTSPLRASRSRSPVSIATPDIRQIGHAGADQGHICFECHTSAMVTMGIFQPFNW